MATVNERLMDAGVGHAVDLQQYSAGVVRRMIALLNRVDVDLSHALATAMESMGAAFNVERLDSLLASVRWLNAGAYAQIGMELPAELRALVEYEAGYQLQLFRAVIPSQVVANVGVAAVNAEQVYAAAMARPFQGVLLREALKGLEDSRARLIRDQVRMGFVENEPIPAIVRRIRGTKTNGYADGLLEMPRRHLEAVVRTAISHTAGVVTDRFMGANADLISAVAWTATLDSRTSEPCRLRDGKRYAPEDHKPIGHKVPWGAGPGRIHWNCRSCSVPVTKSWRELGIDMADASASDRASMDGTVPADLSFADWIKRQSAQRQDDVLGPTRAALMRRGGLTLDRFYTDKGRYLTLDELRQRDAQAFKAAGV